MKNIICKKFWQVINSEIAMGQHIHDHILKDTLKKRMISPEVKKAFRIPIEANISQYDVEKNALIATVKMRFIYMMSIMEAFFKEYISNKSSVEIEKLNDFLKNYNSEWDKKKGGSKSFYNIKYSCFLLNKLYGFDKFYLSNEEITNESGMLRNCIVHNDGVISNTYQLSELKNTLNFLKLNEVLQTKILITDALMALYIEEFRNFISYCNDNFDK